MQRSMAKNPDPAKRGDTIKRKGGDEPAVMDQRKQREVCGQCGGGLLEQKLPDGDAEYTKEGVETEYKAHGETVVRHEEEFTANQTKPLWLPISFSMGLFLRFVACSSNAATRCAPVRLKLNFSGLMVTTTHSIQGELTE